MAFKIVENIGVIGGTNVQFAHNPKTGRVVIIEINPRTSRSSALASKGVPLRCASGRATTGSANASLLRSQVHYATLRAFRIPNAFLPKSFSANTKTFVA